MSAFMELAATYPQFNLDKLCKNCSYSITMRYADFHPLAIDVPKLSLIQIVNNQTLQVLTYPIQPCLKSVTDIGPTLPSQYQPDIGLPVQAIINVSRENSRVVGTSMLAKNRNALSDYLTAMRIFAGVTVHYGYVLRSKIGSVDVVLESLLLQKIRLLMYNLPKPNHVNAVSITPQNRLEYCILRAYLSYTMKYDFINLFPQYGGHYIKYNGIFDALTSKILTLLRCNEKVIAKSVKQTERVPLHRDLISRIDKLAMHLARHIELNSKVNVLDASGPSIVSNFILDQCHLDMYYACLITPIID